ncbi:hypothetical protein ACP275_14G334200 [Erythranthe tilingii]
MGLGSAPVSSSSAPPIYYKLNHHHRQQFHVFVQKIQKQPFAVHTSSSSKNKNKLKSVIVSCSSQLKIEEEEETCELVNGTELTIGENLRAHLFTAVKNNNATGILLLSDIFGFEDSSTTDFAYRLACNGYNVLVPDLFNGDSWTKDRPLEEWITKHSPENIAKTVSASAQWMLDEFAQLGISNKFGIIGFCYGGGRVIDILAQDKGLFGCGVSFYGTRIDSSVAAQINVPLLLITGGNDPLCPISVLEDITNSNEELKMVVFKERGHGFAHRPQTPEEDADAEEAFIIMRNWLSDGLLVNT